MAAMPDNSESMEIVLLQEAHIPEIMEIELEAYPDPWSVGMFWDELRSVRSRFYVLHVGDGLVGYGGFWIVFDEAHIVPTIQATTSTGASVRYNTRDISSAGIYGFIMQYIVHLSTNPITAWIYPLLAIYTLRKYVPKKDSAKDQKKKAEKEDKKEEKEKFRTSSFFAKKIEWYREKHKYGKALMLLYRRMERKLNSLLRGETITTQSVVEMVRAKEGRLNKVREKKLTSFMDKMLKIKAGKLKVKKHDEFEKLFFQMEDTANSI